MIFKANESITLPNGLVISGTHDQIIDAAGRLGYSNPFDTQYYNSSTRGLIRIDGMESRHLRNALLKMLREDPDENSKTWRAMVKEYLSRDLE